jgi:hypothetical protein
MLIALCALCGVAAAAKPRVAVVGDDDAVVASVEKALRGKATLVSEDDERLSATVRISVTGGRRARKHTATVVVEQGADGKQVGKLVVKERKNKLAATVGKQVWKKLGKQIGKARARKPAADTPVAAAPPEPAPPPPPPPDPDPDPAPVRTAAVSPSESRSDESRGSASASGSDSLSVSTRTSASRRSPMFTIAVDERPFYRRLRWNDDYEDVLRRYDLAANAVGVTVAARPLRNLPGAYVQVAGEMVVGVNGSRTDDGMEYGTSGSEWSATAGLGFRLLGLELGVAAAFGEHRFSIDGDQGMGGELLPDVTYRYARGGLDLRRPLGSRLALTGRAGYRHLLGTGDLGNDAWFPRSTGAGVDGSAGLQLRVLSWLGMYARAEVRHYFFAMNPEVGDELIAGGAVDSYLGGAVGFSVLVK